MSVSIYRAPERGLVRDGLRLYLDPMDPACVRMGDSNLRDVSQSLIRLPPAAMTSNINNMTTTDVNGIYTVSASSDNGTGAWQAFNNVIENASWHTVQPTYASTGTHSGAGVTTINSVNYAGEWLQIQFPVSGVLKSYRIGPRQEINGWKAYEYRSPRKWWIMGSSDGSTWNILDAQSGVNDWTPASKSFTIPNNTSKYSYYRIVVNEVGNYENNAAQDSVQISELFYNFAEVYTGQLAGGASWNENGWFELNGSPHMIVTNMIPYINTIRLYTWECWFWDDSPGLTASTATLLMGHYGDVGILNVTGMYISSTGKMSNLTERNSAGTETTHPINCNNLTITDGKWHHVCGVATSTVLLTYLDGQLVGVSSTRPGGLVSSTVPFRLGNALLRYHTCRMGPIRYYVDKALTSAEVRRNYLTDLARMNLADTRDFGVVRNSNLSLYYDPSNTDCYSGSGTSLIDLSGKGNNGTMGANMSVINGVLASTATTTLTTATSFTLGNGRVMTLEFWMRAAVDGPTGVFMSFGAYAAGRTQIITMSPSTLVYADSIDNSATPTTQYTRETINLKTDGNWHHFVAIFSASSVTIYTDGVSNGTTSVHTSALTAALSIQNFVATAQVGPMRMYLDYALTSAEILQNYTVELPKMISKNNIANYSPNTWLTVSTPSSSFVNTTQLPTYNVTSGFIALGASQWIQLPVKTYTINTSGITVIAKVKLNRLDIVQTFLRIQTTWGSTENRILFRITSGTTLGFLSSANGGADSNTIASANFNTTDTFIVACRYDPSSGIRSLWVNGVNIGASTNVSSTLPTVTNALVSINAGFNEVGASDGDWNLYNFAIFERSLSDTEMVKQMGQMGEGNSKGELVLHIDPREVKCYPGSGSILYDLSGNKNHCTLLNGASVIDNQYVLFNGGSQYMTSPLQPELGGGRVHTFEAWFWDDSPPFNTYIRVVGDGSGSRREALNVETTTGRVVTTEVDGSSNVAAIGTNVCDGKWHYLVSVFTANELRIYVDGSLIGTTTRTITSPSSKRNILFGFPSNVGEYGTYRMGASRVWLDTALSAEQIRATYYRERSFYDAEKRGLTLALDPRDPSCYAGSGTTLVDLSRKGNNATLSGGAFVTGEARPYPPLPFTYTGPTNGTASLYTSATLSVSSAPYGNGTYTATAAGVRGYNYSSYGSWAAFDQSATTGWESFTWYTSGTGELSHVDGLSIGGAALSLQLPKAIYLQYYTITNPASTSCPADWVLEGSGNGTTWTLLQTITGASWSVAETKTYMVNGAPSTAYSYYRIRVSKTAGGGTVIINDFRLFGHESFQAFRLDGETQYISTMFRPNLDNNRHYTFELWFWDDAQGLTSSTNTALISNYGPNSTVPDALLHINSDGTIYSAERNSSSVVTGVTYASNICDSRWHHLVSTADSSNMRLYVDGELKGTSSRPGGIITSAMDFVIGGNHLGRYQTASLGPVRIYIDRALTANEIRRNFLSDYHRYAQYIYMLDRISYNMKTACRGAYGIMSLSSTYTGPVVQIRRGSDNAIQDFYGDIYGNLRTSPNLSSATTITTWLNGATGYVAIWYDQSGNGNHATQATLANQPEIDATNLRIDFKTSSDRFLTMPSGTIPTGTLNAPYTLVVKHATVTGTTTGVFISSGGTTLNTANSLKYNGSSYANYWWNNDLVFGTSAANSVVAVTYNGTNRQGFVNGTGGTITASSGYTVSAGPQYIGRDINGGAYLNGQINYIAIFGNSMLDYDIQRFK